MQTGSRICTQTPVTSWCFYIPPIFYVRYITGSMIAHCDLFAKHENAICSGASKISNSLDRLSNVCYSVNILS